MAADAAGPLGRRFLRLAAHDAGAPALLGGDGRAVATRAALAGLAVAVRDAVVKHAPPGPVALWLPNGAPLVAGFAGISLAGRRPVSSTPRDRGGRAVRRRDRRPRCSRNGTRRELAGGVAGRRRRVGHRRSGAVVPLPHHTAALKLTSGSSGTRA
jgi:hypothetical protein